MPLKDIGDVLKKFLECIFDKIKNGILLLRSRLQFLCQQKCILRQRRRLQKKTTRHTSSVVPISGTTEVL